MEKIIINGIEIDPQYYIDKWTKWALEATPATDEQVISNVKTLYKKANLQEPKVIVFRNYEKFINYQWASVGDSVWNSVRDSVWNSVRDSVMDSLSASVGGYHWADNLSFADIFADTKVLSPEKIIEIEEYKKLLETQRIAVLTEKIAYVLVAPTIRRNDDGQLHSDQRCAVEWENETGQYYLDGVNLPKKMWQRIVSKEMTFSEIMKIEISDQRTVALKYNPQAIINENAVLVHKDNRNNELYLIEGKEINTITGFPKMYFLKMLCPTGRTFIEGVEPDFAEKHPNATECQAELCGLILSEYMSMTLES